MDSEIESGCEPAPAPGGGQGSPGGPVPAGGNALHNGETPIVLGLNEVVYLRWKGELLRCVTTHFKEFGGAINVANGNGEYICERKDLITEAEHLANVHEENKLAAARRNSRILNAYMLIPSHITKTAKRNKWLAEYCGVTPREAAGAVMSLSYWKLIEIPKNEDTKEEDPN